VTMSATRNTDSLKPETGEFRSRVPPSEPVTTKGVCLFSLYILLGMPS
jgi:hypothetical protein